MSIPCKYSNSFFIFLICLSSCSTEDTRKIFQKEIAVKPDTISIDNSRDTLISGSKGTILFFPKDAFTFPDGTSPKGKISIELKECYSFLEMIRENLATTAGNQLLETRGMIYVSAFSDNKELQLKNGKSYIIHFPKDTTEKNKPMNLYFGNIAEGGNVDWKIDTQSILKPNAGIYLTSWSYPCSGEEKDDFFRFRDDTSMNLLSYFYKTFDNTKLSLGDKLLNKYYSFSFRKTRNGDLIDKKLTEVGEDFEPVKNPEIDKYVIRFFDSVPALNPNFCPDGSITAEGSIHIGFTYEPGYRNKEDYNHLFNQKYSVFKNQNIQTMKEAELNYYIFSASKLGWINCDYFWETKDEKIDYVVKADAASKPNIKLIFKQAKSIMPGILTGDKYIFKNVPVDQEIKIVAVTFKGNKPMLSVTETKTSKQVFDNFQYRDFTIADLEHQLGNP